MRKVFIELSIDPILTNYRFLGLLIGGGQVAGNANISSAVNPKWRTAKVHVIGFYISHANSDTTDYNQIYSS